jgi:ketosteroid isomerase-like protein
MATVEARLEQLEAKVARLQDEAALYRLIAAYGPAVDTGSSQAAARLFVEDGVYDVGGMSRSKGHAQIAALFDGEPHQTIIKNGSAHVMGLPHLTVDGDSALAVTYSRLYVHREDGFGLYRISANRWTFRRTADGWRIVERVNRVLDGAADAREVLKAAVEK